MMQLRLLVCVWVLLVAVPMAHGQTQDTAAAPKKKGFFGRLFGGRSADDTLTGKERRQQRREQRAQQRAQRDSLKTVTERGGVVLQPALMRQDPRIKSLDSTVRQSLAKRDINAALRYLELYKRAQDSLSLAIALADSASSEAERAQNDRLLALERARVLESEQRVQEARTYGVAAGLFMSLALLGVLLVLFRDRSKTARLLTQQNLQLTELNEEIRAQRDLLEHQNVHILDSIQYAKRIQEAILPSRTQIESVLPQSFVYYRPKDIVSGDFFWVYPTPTQTYIAAVDCTGHGVPGAFMSVLGMSLLNQIVLENPGLAPGEVLTRLHHGVIRSLRQQVGSSNQDGMDLVLCALSADRQTLHMAGANNSMYLWHQGQMLEVRGDKAPIGGARYADFVFQTKTVTVEPGDAFFLFSDGFPDQFGGDRGRKFTYKRLEALLSEIGDKPLHTQVSRIDATFEAWRGNREQLDDVLLIGVRV